MELDREHVEVVRATAGEQTVLENLLSLYLHDFSEVFGNPPGPDGRFLFDALPRFFEDQTRFPFLIRAGGDLGGFALESQGSVISESREVWDLNEFFVVRGLRRRGVGTAAASALFQLFSGTWEVRALDENKGAGEFWEKAISAHTNGSSKEMPWESEPGRTWRVFSFVQGDS